MKRITALIISLLLVLSAVFCPAVSMAEETADINRETTILNQLGFLKTIPEDFTQTVTRGEMVQTIVDMMKGDIIQATGAVITDINEFHDYYPAMTRAIKLGLVSGPVTRPDDAVTFNETIKMLVCMLGYNDYALHKGGWPNGYNIMAHNIGLLDGIKSVGDAKVTYADAIKILYNAISIDVLEPVYIGDSVTYGTIEGRTILTQSNGIQREEGVIEAVKGKALYGDSDLANNQIVIDGIKFTHDFANISDYVGYNVEYYYDIDTKALKAFYPVNNKVKSIDAESVYAYDNNVIYYEDEDYNEEEIKFSQAAIILFNDVVIDAFSGEYFKNKQGEFKFIDNDGDGKYDIIFLDITEDYVVKIANSTSGTIYDYYDPNKTLCLSDEDGATIKFVDEFGNDMVVSELMRYDVISVKKSLDGKNVIAIYSNSEVRGSVDAIGTVGDKMFITINGTEYEATPDFAKGEKLRNGEWGVFGLTTTGKIASINRGFTTGTSVYGYLINAKSGSGIDTTIKYRVLSEKNEVLILTSAKKLVVDGKSVSAQDAFDAFGGVNTVSQPIIFETNADGFISRIDTINYNPDYEIRDSLREMYNGYSVSYDEDGNVVETPKTTLEWRSGTGIFGSKIATSGNTILFRVDETNSAPDEDYSAGTMSSLSSGTNYYAFKAYKAVEDSHMADIIVMYASQSSSSSGNSTYIISDISLAIDGNENEAYKLTLYNGKNKFTYYAKDSRVFTEAKWLGAGASDAPLDDHVFIPGDIIKLTRDQAGYINKIELVYDKANEKFYSSTNYNAANANAEFRISYNEVYSIYSNNILVHKGPIPEGTETLTYDSLESYNVNGFTILVFDEDNRTNPVRTGSISDLSDYKTTGKGSMIYLQSAYTTNGQIIVYK